MAKVLVHKGVEDKVLAKGDYEYVEAGLEKDGKPSFHISFGKAFTVYVTFDSKEEFEEFLENLREQIPHE